LQEWKIGEKLAGFHLEGMGFDSRHLNKFLNDVLAELTIFVNLPEITRVTEKR